MPAGIDQGQAEAVPKLAEQPTAQLGAQTLCPCTTFYSRDSQAPSNCKAARWWHACATVGVQCAGAGIDHCWGRLPSPRCPSSCPTSPPFSLLTHIINFFPPHTQIASLIALFWVKGKKGMKIGWEKIWGAYKVEFLVDQTQTSIMGSGG